MFFLDRRDDEGVFKYFGIALGGGVIGLVVLIVVGCVYAGGGGLF